MRVSLVNVNDHALGRWKQRAATFADTRVSEIVDAVKKSTLIKKDEPLPYPMPRVEGCVYSVYNKVMFVMKCISIDHFSLVTIVAGERRSGCPKIPGEAQMNQKKRFQQRQKKKPEADPDKVIERKAKYERKRNWEIVDDCN